METNRPIPFVAIHVGEYLKELLEVKGMKQSELSNLSGVPRPIISDILKGKRGITPEQSNIFGKALDVSYDYLYKFQMRYDVDKARIADRVVEQNKAIKIWEIIVNYIQVKILKKAGIIKCKDVVEDVAAVFKMFGVSTVDAFIGIVSKRENDPAYVKYRKSEKLTTDPKALFTWKYLCIYRDRAVDMAVKFDKECRDSLIKELNVVFFENNNTIKRVKDTLAKYGINFMLEEKEGQLPVDGISFWVNGHPTVCLTMRHSGIDKMAFNVMHELGHIFLHLNEHNSGMANDSINDYELKESEADSFAQGALIPDYVWNEFRRGFRPGVSLDAYIRDSSSRHGIHPRIILGRLTHESKFYSVKSSIPKNIN